MKAKHYIILVLSIILFIILYNIYNIEVAVSSYQTEQVRLFPFGCISPNKALKQYINIPYDQTIRQIDIKLATYARNNTNNNIISIIKGNDLLFKKQINSKNIIDNSFYHIPNLNIQLNKGDKLIISIESEDATANNCITAWVADIKTANKLYQYDVLTSTYNEIKGELVVKLYNNSKLPLPQYLSSRFLQIPVWIFYGLTILLSILLILVIIIILFPENDMEIKSK